MKMLNHTFVICAYKESKYLKKCILSLKKQDSPSKIIMVTSTPNQYIREMAEEYNIPLYINEGESGITQDWNFGIGCTNTKYVTIAHQDDIYEKNYSKEIIRNMEISDKPLIAFTDYFEIRNGKKVWKTSMLQIKRIMLFPLRFRIFWKNKFMRRRILSLGDPICCPSVTFCMENLKTPIFRNGFRSCEDWEAWENISREKGDFIYINIPLMCHRIHEESATSAILADHARAKENYIMYCKFWPKWIAGIINKFYNKSEKSNELE